MDKRSLTERDICTKFILLAVKRAGWDEMVQVREEGRIRLGVIDDVCDVGRGYFLEVPLKNAMSEYD
jgi:hypothetical protein